MLRRKLKQKLKRFKILIYPNDVLLLCNIIAVLCCVWLRHRFTVSLRLVLLKCWRLCVYVYWYDSCVRACECLCSLYVFYNTMYCPVENAYDNPCLFCLDWCMRTFSFVCLCEWWHNDTSDNMHYHNHYRWLHLNVFVITWKMKPAYQLNIYIHFKGKLLEILSASKNKQIIKINVRKENKKLIYYFFFHSNYGWIFIRSFLLLLNKCLAYYAKFLKLVYLCVRFTCWYGLCFWWWFVFGFGLTTFTESITESATNNLQITATSCSSSLTTLSLFWPIICVCVW